MRNEILLIEILDYHNGPPTIAARFWWSNDFGVTCDEPRLMKLLEESGITVPGRSTVYPKDGRPFFDLLSFRFKGLLGAQLPVLVEQQGQVKQS